MYINYEPGDGRGLWATTHGPSGFNRENECRSHDSARPRDATRRMLQSEGLQLQLQEQLRVHVLWSILDKRREDSGRALMLVPPTGEGGRGWLVRTPQSLLKKEFVDGILDKDPDDLEKGDRGIESCAAHAPRQSRAQKAAPSDCEEAAVSKE